MNTIEDLARATVDCGFSIYRDLGPGLLESVYEELLTHLLEQRGIRVDRQKPVSFEYRGKKLENGFRVDLLVEQKLLVELKSQERVAPVHTKQVLTYLRLMDLPLGLLINFGAPSYRDGIQRVLNTRADMSALDLHRYKVAASDDAEK